MVADRSTIVDVLRARARDEAATLALTWLDDGERDGATFTYEELDRVARRIAVGIRAHAQPGDRVLLVYPAGLDFVTAIWGCLYAGVIPTPAYPPDPMRVARTAPRLSAIANDARVDVTLSIDLLCEQRELLAPYSDRFRTMQWIGTDTLPAGLEDDWHPPLITPQSNALLQYSSGSTGTPRGVLVTHANITANLDLQWRAFHGRSRAVRSLMWLPQYHDMCLFNGILHSVWAGFPFWLFSPIDFLRRPARWMEAVSRLRATYTVGPNFAFDLAVRKTPLAERGKLDLSSLTCFVNAAEPVRGSTMQRFREAFEPCGLDAVALRAWYGLAENTLGVCGSTAGITFEQFDRDALDHNEARPAVPDGTDAYNLPRYPLCSEHEVAIVDPETRRRCAAGRVGEIWVRGPSVCNGYFDRPGATVETFRARTADTFDGPFLRTGDLGFQRAGNLFLTGRLKDLIIVRGRNLYPQDLERAAESSHPLVRPGSCAAFSITGPEGEEVMVVAEANDTEAASIATALQAIRTAVTAACEVAVETVVLIERGALPKTSSGKVQRRATRDAWRAGQLPVVACSTLGRADGPSEATDASDPRAGAIATWLTSEIALELGRDPATLDPRVPLVQLGVDSLTAVTLQHRVELRFGHTIDIGTLLSDATIATVADQLLHCPATEPTTAPNRRAAPPRTDAPTTSGQQALWFLQQLAPDSAAYHIAAAARLAGPLDLPAVESALRALMARHSALRTTFPLVAGVPIQRLLPAPTVDFRVDDLAWDAVAVAACLTETARQPFDFEHDPLFRVRLLRHGPTDHSLLVVAHHIIVDHDALAILARELVELYHAARDRRTVALPPVAADMLAFAEWQARSLETPDGEQLAAWWLAQLAEPPPPLELPTDAPRPPTQRFRGATHTRHLDPALSARVREFARDHHVTVSTALLATYATLLARLSGQDEFVIGCPATGRSREWTETVGYLMNPLALRIDLRGEPTFADALTRARTTLLAALDHQAYPFPLLVQRLRVPRDPARSPLFDVLFNVLPNAATAPTAVGEGGGVLELGPLRLEGLPVARGAAQFDLSLTVADDRTSILTAFEYDCDLFDAATIVRIADQFHALLHAVTSDPQQPIAVLPLCDDRIDAVAPAAPTPPVIVLPTQIARIAAQHPDTTAVRASDGRLSYRDLDERANALAITLRAAGVGPDTIVGVLLDRTTDLPVALLGILKAGGAYLPLDPRHPVVRLQAALDDAQVRTVVTHADGRHAAALAERSIAVVAVDTRSIHQGAASAPVVELRSEHLAYVIFTSGSTGRPKGVAISHRALAHALGAMQHTPGMDAHDVLLAVTTISFDIAALELFLPLLCGAQVVIADDATASDGRALHRLLREHAATVMQATPATWRMLLDAGWQPSGDVRILCGGEAMPPDLAQALCRGGAPVWNLYGPTEATIWCTAFRVDASSGPVPIGYPIGDTVCHVLDPAHHRVPPGVPGELYIGGPSLARDYLDLPDMTAARFIADPFGTDPAARLYRTGDLVRQRPDGRLSYLGRTDHQIKLRGFRIEPGDVEAALRRHPVVADAAVVLRHDRPGTAHLVGYVVVTDRTIDLESIRLALRDTVPAYMVPSILVPIEALPETANRKLDRRALPAPVWNGGAHPVARVAPRSELETMLEQLWARVLQTDTVCITDDFFVRGGDSLAAVRVCTALSQQFGTEIAVRFLLDHPTVVGAAAALTAAGITVPAQRPPTPARPAPNDDRAPFVQVTSVPFLTSLATGAMRPVDAVAFAALPTDLPQRLGRDRDATVAAWCAGQPLWARTFDTVLGRIGLVLLPRFEHELHHDLPGVLDDLRAALGLARHIGARAVSLTGLLPSATGYGRDLVTALNGEGHLPITTGHATTAAGVALTVQAALRAAGRSLARERLAVLGLGSIGRSTLPLLLDHAHPQSVLLCDVFGQEDRLRAIGRELATQHGYRGPVQVVGSRGTLPDEVYDASVIVAAASLPNLLDPWRLRPGTIVVDDGYPPGCNPTAAWERWTQRGDVLVLGGGTLRAPYPITETRFIPPGISPDVVSRLLLDRDPREIGSCVLSGLLSDRHPTAAVTIGLATAEACRGHLHTLSRLGFDPAALHLGTRRYDATALARFRTAAGDSMHGPSDTDNVAARI